MIWTGVVLCVFLLNLSGCVGKSGANVTPMQNEVQAEAGSQNETKVQSETVEQEFRATGAQYTIKESPLLHSENPQEENLAGMLQEAASGMMVQLVAGNVSGSGVLWKVQGDELWIATAAHVVTQGTDAVEITFSDGFNMTAERVAADAEPGMSGGGIFDSRGHFLGILCGGDESGQLAAVPISVINTFSENF